MVKLADVLENGDISLSKLTGYQVKDIRGRVSREFNSGTFVISTIILEDPETKAETSLWIGGEHDFPYIEDRKAPNLDEETLSDLYEEDK